MWGIYATTRQVLYNSLPFGINGKYIIMYQVASSGVEAAISYSNNTVKWYVNTTSASGITWQLNDSGTTYYYFAIS